MIFIQVASVARVLILDVRAVLHVEFDLPRAFRSTPLLHTRGIGSLPGHLLIPNLDLLIHDLDCELAAPGPGGVRGLHGEREILGLDFGRAGDLAGLLVERHARGQLPVRYLPRDRLHASGVKLRAVFRVGLRVRQSLGGDDRRSLTDDVDGDGAGSRLRLAVRRRGGHLVSVEVLAHFLRKARIDPDPAVFPEIKPVGGGAVFLRRRELQLKVVDGLPRAVIVQLLEPDVGIQVHCDLIEVGVKARYFGRRHRDLVALELRDIGHDTIAGLQVLLPVLVLDIDIEYAGTACAPGLRRRGPEGDLLAGNAGRHPVGTINLLALDRVLAFRIILDRAAGAPELEIDVDGLLHRIAGSGRHFDVGLVEGERAGREGLRDVHIDFELASGPVVVAVVAGRLRLGRNVDGPRAAAHAGRRFSRDGGSAIAPLCDREPLGPVEIVVHPP